MQVRAVASSAKYDMCDIRLAIFLCTVEILKSGIAPPISKSVAFYMSCTFLQQWVGLSGELKIELDIPFCLLKSLTQLGDRLFDKNLERVPDARCNMRTFTDRCLCVSHCV